MRLAGWALIGILCFPGRPLFSAVPIQADFLIKGVTWYSGTGEPGKVGDIALRGDRIVAVGSFACKPGAKILSGKGLVAAPGFIDLHTHSDSSEHRDTEKGPIVEPLTRDNLNYLKQGVTTIVTGNCGFGPTDIAAFLKKVDRVKVGTNVLALIPHNNLREKVMGNVNRAPSRKEMAQMISLIRQGMKDGAWGLSTGLIYMPGVFSKTDELAELAKAVAPFGGLYASHMRDEGPALLASIEEAIEIGKKANVAVHLSHLKADRPRVWGKAEEALALIRKLRAAGMALTADQYPYTASSTSLADEVIPPEMREGSLKDFLARLQDPVLGPKIRTGIAHELAEYNGGKTIHLASLEKTPEWQGKDLVSLAKETGMSVIDLVLEIEKRGGAKTVNFCMSEPEVRAIMKEPYVATASDGRAMAPGATVPHPRSYGTFPRKIGTYSISERVLPLEQAIRSASGLPADILHLPQRGYLKPGFFADVVVFDPATFRDTATFEKPHQYATGVTDLFVNGVRVIDSGRYTGALAGKSIRKTPPTRAE